MRRADREVHAPEDVEAILRDCADVRVAYQDAQGLTIVPVNFAYEFAPGMLRLFMHSAREGRKIDAIRAAGNVLPVAFEMDCDATVYTGRTPCSSTTAFRSIIGTGVASLVEDTEQKIEALTLLMRQRTAMHDVTFLLRQVAKVAVWRIESTEFTAKRHPAPAARM
ncbi:pyridoxamine 5'-phosphate oxidase family protein [Bifidobacterium criceti]|nr:pyridoxamine 5'-phosphate oxidase family protein [Bifidobacterium criceti]